ncbi:MAG: hypothetical protein IPM81_02055 [Saprospirales bacterium]|nr:hypothetical protein [Saprospirales bacterium]
MLMAARWEEAVQIAEQALTHCLSRAGQLNARMLHLEALAMQILPASGMEAARLYLGGIRRPLRIFLAAQYPEAERPYEISFLSGRAHLFEGEMREAQGQFELALSQCKGQLHFGMLKTLIRDAEKMLVETTRQSAQRSLGEQDFPKALERITQAMRQLQGPEALLHDLAEIYLAGVSANRQINAPAPMLPDFLVSADWNANLQQVLLQTEDLLRARHLIALANTHCPATAARGQKLLKQLDGLEDTLASASALDRSTELSQAGRFDEALAALELPNLNADAPGLPVLRQRAFLLLKLGRFEEADHMAGAIATSGEASDRQFAERFQSLKIKLQLQTVQQHLKRQDPGAALRLISVLQPESREDRLETGYCKAYTHLLEGCQLVGKGVRREEILSEFQNRRTR